MKTVPAEYWAMLPSKRGPNGLPDGRKEALDGHQEGDNAPAAEGGELERGRLRARCRQDSCALSSGPIGPPSGTVTHKAASRPGSGGTPIRFPRRT